MFNNYFVDTSIVASSNLQPWDIFQVRSGVDGPNAISGDGTIIALKDGSAVYVYSNDGTGATLLDTLTPSETAGDYGRVIDISQDGNTIAVGDRTADHSGYTDFGIVYIYERSGDSWIEQDTLIYNGTAADYKYFGGWLSLDATGDRCVVRSGDKVQTYTRGGSPISWSYEEDIYSGAADRCMISGDSGTIAVSDGSSSWFKVYTYSSGWSLATTKTTTAAVFDVVIDHVGSTIVTFEDTTTDNTIRYYEGGGASWSEIDYNIVTDYATGYRKVRVTYDGNHIAHQEGYASQNNDRLVFYKRGVSTWDADICVADTYNFFDGYDGTDYTFTEFDMDDDRTFMTFYWSGAIYVLPWAFTY